MKLALILALLFFLSGCSQNRKHTDILKPKEVHFRITLNQNRDLSDTELDSLENSKPFYVESYKENDLYNLLEAKGVISQRLLDTTRLHLALVTWENPEVSFDKILLTLDTTYQSDHIIVKANDKVSKVDLGPRLLGDIFVSYIDLNNDGISELLVMKKYYVMGGYNFDLKAFDIN